MRGIQIKEYVKGPQDLKVTDLPDPVPNPDQYLIEIHATATNFYDLLQIRGKYQHQPPLPWISGSEFSGTIISTPSSSSSPKYKPGDRVFGASQGGYATLVCAQEASLYPVPDSWSFFEAAGLFVTAPTSYGALVTRANIKSGDYVLIHAAAGGVGLAAVQIAKAFGATVIATAGTKRKLEVAREFGADHVIDYGDATWPDQVKKLTPNNRGVDIVFDPVGLIDKSTKCIRWNGRLLVIGFAAGNIEKVAMNKNEPEKIQEVWEGIFKLIKEGKFKGTVFRDKEFVGLEDVPGALESLGGRGTWGKVVVKVEKNGKEGRSKI
ncbi:alcohol dehydrogenase, zinc-containing [Botrytis cinerea]